MMASIEQHKKKVQEAKENLKKSKKFEKKTLKPDNSEVIHNSPKDIEGQLKKN